MLLFFLPMSVGAEPVSPYIETGFGKIHRKTLRNMCLSEKVFVGKVVSFRSYEEPRRAPSLVALRPLIYSDLTIQVERSVWGQINEVEVVTVYGGTVDGVTMGTNQESPEAREGLRYMFGLSTLKKSLTGSVPVGTELLLSSFWIRADVELPTDEEIRGYLKRFCE